MSVRRVLLVLLAALCAWFIAATPAFASGGGGGSTWPTNPPGNQQSGSNGTVKTTNTHTCSLFGGPNGYGLTCAGGGGGYESFAQILGGDPVPSCWDVDLTAEELASSNLATQPGQVWVRRQCLPSERITTTADVKASSVALVSVPTKDCPSPKWSDIPNKATGLVLNDMEVANKKPYDCHIVLTVNQQNLVVDPTTRQTAIPFPTLIVTPALAAATDDQTLAVNARVNEEVALYDLQDTVDAPPEVDAGGIPMRAVLTALDLSFPNETDQQALTPTVDGRTCSIAANPGDTPDSLPQACWYKFLRASATGVGEAFNVLATAHWEIQYNNGDGHWLTLNTFTKFQTTAIKVGSVQALVIPN